METTRTERGFGIIKFTDFNDKKCSLQESSLATDDAIWLGCDEIGLKRFTPYKGWEDVPLEQDHPHGVTHIANNRMHLSQEQVRELLPALQYFAEHGSLPTPGEA